MRIETESTEDTDKDGKRGVGESTRELIQKAWDAEFIRRAQLRGRTVYCILPPDPMLDARIGAMVGVEIIDSSKVPNCRWETVWQNTVES